MNDQAAYLRKLAKKNNNLPEAKFSFSRVIAVTSGKGGVGKTNFTINFAIELVALGKKVVVFDADLGLANTDIILGINPQYNLSHVIRGQKTLKEIIVNVPYGFKLIPASSGVAELANLNEYEVDKFIRDFEVLDKDTDILLIDTAAGIARNVLNFVLASQEVIIITTKEPTAITDAYALVKTLVAKEKGIDIRLVVNMCKTEEEAKAVANKIVTVCKRFLNIEVNYIGFILQDNSVSNSVIRRKPLAVKFPHSKASKNIKSLTRKIVGSVPEKPRESFLRRLKKSFAPEALAV